MSDKWRAHRVDTERMARWELVKELRRVLPILEAHEHGLNGISKDSFLAFGFLISKVKGELGEPVLAEQVEERAPYKD